ncbi:hypothetical protein [Pseudomonas oryzihabitans]|uniref:hypothetical protein n=1 Tax=Pseudomonas oryzihabitans TaxID=47885 RepID=UPI0028A993D7|nr:hypothetical protein [Pseudomonas oryzihabitans]
MRDAFNYRRRFVFGGLILACSLALGASLAACSSTVQQPSGVKPIDVVPQKVMVSKPCVKEAPPRPIYRWGRGQYPASDKEAGAILMADREQAVQYGLAWEAATVGCIQTQGVLPPASESQPP